MDRVIQVLIVFPSRRSHRRPKLGALSAPRRIASVWKQETERAQAATAQALAAERRLANAQTKGAAALALSEATMYRLRDCPVPNDIARMLTTAADETRAD